MFYIKSPISTVIINFTLYLTLAKEKNNKYFVIVYAIAFRIDYLVVKYINDIHEPLGKTKLTIVP